MGDAAGASARKRKADARLRCPVHCSRPRVGVGVPGAGSAGPLGSGPRQWSQRPSRPAASPRTGRGCIVSCSPSTNSAAGAFPLSRMPTTRNIRGDAMALRRACSDPRCRPLPHDDDPAPRRAERRQATLRRVPMSLRSPFGRDAEADVRRDAFRQGVRKGAPLLLPTAIWGLVAGVAMVKTGLSVAQALAMTLFGLRRQRADGGAAADRSRRAGRNCAADRHHRQPPLRHLLCDALALLRSPAARTTAGSRLLRGRHDGRDLRRAPGRSAERPNRRHGAALALSRHCRRDMDRVAVRVGARHPARRPDSGAVGARVRRDPRADRDDGTDAQGPAGGGRLCHRGRHRRARRGVAAQAWSRAGGHRRRCSRDGRRQVCRARSSEVKP